MENCEQFLPDHTGLFLIEAWHGVAIWGANAEGESAWLQLGYAAE